MHKIDCTCFICKAKRGEFKGENHPLFGKHPRAWNKGLTKETDIRVAEYSNKLVGIKFTEERIKNLSIAKTGIKRVHSKDCKCPFCKRKRQEPHSLDCLCAICEAQRGRHWNWQGGKSYEIYPLGWNRTYKEQIRRRDNYICQICNIPEIECTRKLHVHHIDYNKQNINDKNLISLCNSCHMKTNYKRNYWEEYFSKLFKSKGG